MSIRTKYEHSIVLYMDEMHNPERAVQGRSPSDTGWPVAHRLQAMREQHPYIATALETVIVWAGREAATAAIHTATPVRVGHGWKNSRAGELIATPMAAIAIGMILSPHIEEYVCREQPSRYLDNTNHPGMQRGVGTLVSAAFAAGHAGREAIPLPQFVGGLNYWRLQRSRGFKHAVMAHALHNGLAYVTGQATKRFTSTG